MRSLKDYLTEAEDYITKPAVGDVFEIEIARDEMLISGYITECVDDGIVIELDDRGVALLEGYGYVADAKSALGYFEQAENLPKFMAGRVNGVQYSRNDIATANTHNRLEKGFSKIVDKTIFKNSLSEKNTELLKLQKALFIFDSAPESEMLNLLNIKNKKDYFYKLNLQIIYDFYVSKNDKKKAEEIKLLIDEK